MATVAKTLAAAAASVTISVSSTQTMRLGAIKSNHFVLITDTQTHTMNRTDEAGYENSLS